MPDSDIYALPPSAKPYAAPPPSPAASDVYALPTRRPSGYNAQGEAYYIDPDPGAAGIAMTRQEPRTPPPSFSDRLLDFGGFADLAANGMTLGAWPHVAAFFQGALPGMFSDEGFGGGYQRVLAGINENMNRVRTHSPTISAIVEMAGAMAPAVVTAGAALPAQAARAPAYGSTLWGLLRPVLQGGALGAAGGAFYGFMEGSGGFEERIRNAGDYAIWGGGIGMAIPVAFSVAPAMRRALRTVAPQSRKVRIAGVPAQRFSEENIRSAATEYRNQARQGFAELDASGVRIPGYDVEFALRGFQVTAEEALSETPAAQAYLDNLIGRTVQRPAGVPIGTLESWRQELNAKIRDNWRQGHGAEAEMFEAIRDALDNQIMELGENAELRSTWLHTIRLDALENAATRAADRAGRSTTGLTYEAAFQAELQRIKDNKRLWTRFSPGQQEAITTAIRDGGPLASLDGLLNKVLGTGMRRVLTNLAGMGGSIATGNMLYALPAAVDTAARFSRNAAVESNLNRLLDAVTGRPQPSIPMQALWQSQSALTRAAVPGVAGGVGARQMVTGGGF